MTLFYNQRYSNTDLHSHRIPDFVKLAEAHGLLGLRVEKRPDLEDAVQGGHFDIRALRTDEEAHELVAVAAARYAGDLGEQALREAAEHLALAAEHADQADAALDLLAEELRLAHEALQQITGRFSADDLLGEIFSRFCIGK